MEYEIRRLLRELASEASPVPMVERAVGAGLRLRRRRIGTAATSTAISVVMVLAAGLILRPGSSPPLDPNPGRSTPLGSVTAQPSPSGTGVPITVITDATRGIALIDRWYAGGNGRTVLDPYHSEYVEPFPQADQSSTHMIPSPDGELVVKIDRQVPDQIQVRNFRTGLEQTYPVPRYLGEPHWSPDSERLLFTSMDGEIGALTGHVLDLVAGTWNDFPAHLPAGEFCKACDLTWLPDGQRVGLSIVNDTIDATGSNERPQGGVRLFSLTGQVLDLLPIQGYIGGDAGSWSPDRTKVVITSTRMIDRTWRTTTQIVNATTGAVIFDAGGWWGASADVRWVDNSRFLVPWPAWHGDSRLPRNGWISLMRVDGTELHRWYVPDDACCLVVHPQQ